MKYFINFVVSCSALILILMPAYVLAAPVIYISGVQTSGGTGHTTNDFIELFNPGAEPVNLKGFSLVKRTATSTTDSSIKSWTADAFIPGYSFFLWANSGFTDITAAPDVSSSASVADDNGVALRAGAADTGAVIDSVAWGAAVNGFSNVSANIPANSVLRRQDLFSAQSTYSILANGLPRNSALQVLPPADTVPPEVIVVPPPDPDPEPDPAPEASPGDANPLPVYLPLRINELLPNPSGTDEGQEQVEIFNPNALPVDVTGWFLDDGSGSGPTSSAYALTGLIQAGEFKTFVTPAGKFALNNTGGDSVQLFSPDKKVVDTVTYPGTAEENKTYQRFDTGWQWGEQSLGSQNILPVPPITPTSTLSTSTNDAPVNYSGLSLSEFYPTLNSDEDAWVEIANSTAVDIDLGQWQIDIASSHLKKPSDSVIVVPGPSVVPAKGFMKVYLPSAVAAAMEEDVKYWLLLYSPDDKPRDAVNVKGLKQQLSYAKIAALGWQWTAPTPTEPNQPFAPPPVAITEVLPAHKNAEGDSFIELFNGGNTPAYLGNLQVKIGSKTATLPEYTMQPQEYYAVYAGDLPAALSVKGMKIVLEDPNASAFTYLNYPKAPSGLSYMESNGKWVWTSAATPAALNVYEKEVVEDTKKSAAVKKTTTKKPAATTKKTPAKTTTKTANKNSNASDGGLSFKDGKKPAWGIGIAAALVLTGGIVIWMYVKEPEVS
jgi:hypothetical protein